MSDNFTSNFSLFPAKEKKSEKSPDMTGTIEIPVDQINALVAHLGTEPESDWKGDGVVKLRIAAWSSESKAGTKYLKGKVSTPMQQQQSSAASDLPF